MKKLTKYDFIAINKALNRNYVKGFFGLSIKTIARGEEMKRYYIEQIKTGGKK